MYEVEKTSQLRKFFRHNAYTEMAMTLIYNWLEKVNANFKNEDDFNTRMPKLIERYLTDANEDTDYRNVVASAYFGIRDCVTKWQELLDKKTKTSEPKAEKVKVNIKKEEPKAEKKTKTERLYKCGNMEVYKTELEDAPALMILIKNYSTDDLFKAIATEIVKDFFDLLY